MHGSQRWLQSNPRKTPYCLPILQRPADWRWPPRRRTSSDGDAPPARLRLRFALPATLCLIQFGRSRKRRMETKKFLWLLRQGYSRQRYALNHIRVCDLNDRLAALARRCFQNSDGSALPGGRTDETHCVFNKTRSVLPAKRCFKKWPTDGSNHSVCNVTTALVEYLALNHTL